MDDNELENVVDEVVVINDELGEEPYYDITSYNGYGKRKCLLDNQDFLPDQDIYDGASHLAQSISVVSVTEADEVDLGGEIQLEIIPTPATANVPTNAVWESSDLSKAYVVGQGLVVAVGLGEVTITATDPDNPANTADFDLTVVEDTKAPKPDPDPENPEHQQQTPQTPTTPEQPQQQDPANP